jgi:chromate transport protein ChrA
MGKRPIVKTLGFASEIDVAGSLSLAVLKSAIAGMIAAVRRLIRAVKILARDGRIPKPLRALAAFGVLPIPGPFDEAVLLIVGLLLLAFYRRSLREAWSEAATPYFAKPSY